MLGDYMGKLGVFLSASCLIFTALIWALGFSFKNDLRDSGAAFVANMQDSRAQSLVNFMVVLYWSVPFSLPIFFDITLHTLGPLPGLKAIGMLSFSIYISALLRILIGWPQIYWTRQGPRGLGCLLDWALPSPSLTPLTAVIVYYGWQMRASARLSVLISVAYLVVQYFVEGYLGYSDYFTSLMSVSLGASLAVCLHIMDEYFEKSLNYVVENKVRGAVWMVTWFILCIAITFAIYEGHNSSIDSDWEDELEDVCEDADLVTLNANCLTTCVVIALFFGAASGSIAAMMLVSEPWWSNTTTRLPRVLVTIAYLYFGFALVFVVSIVKQNIGDSSSDSSVNFVVKDRYGYFTFFYGLITSFILGITLTAILPMLVHICFGRKRNQANVDEDPSRESVESNPDQPSSPEAADQPE